MRYGCKLSVWRLPILIFSIQILFGWADSFAKNKYDLPDPDEKWLRFQTANFLIFTNADKAMASHVGFNLEHLRQFIAVNLLTDCKLPGSNMYVSF